MRSEYASRAPMPASRVSADDQILVLNNPASSDAQVEVATLRNLLLSSAATRVPLYSTVVRDIRVMASPPTIGAATAATAIVTPQFFYTHSGPSVPDSLNTAFFTTTIGAPWKLKGATFPDYNYIDPSVVASNGGGSNQQRIEFDLDCTAFELMYKGITGAIRIWVDGELVSLTPITVPNDGSVNFLPVTFASRALRRITIDWYNPAFGGIVLGPNDTVYPAAKVRPKVLMIGDSFIEGTGSNQVDNLAFTLGNSLGWDVWSGGQGGSGYAAPGSYTGKYSTRIPFYAGIDFDAIIVSGGINDMQAQYVATVGAEAASLFALIKATWPNAVWIATSPLVNRGVAGWGGPNVIPPYQAIKTAALDAGFYFADVMELPISGSFVAAAAGTMSAASSASATSLSTSFRPPIGATIEVGSGATIERRVVTATAGGGPYTLTVQAMTFAHSIGERVSHVGGSLWTGSGRVGAPTGTGNCDLYVSSDTTHPTVAGHYAIGRALAHQIANALNPF